MKAGKPDEHPLNLQNQFHDFGVSETNFVAVSGYLYVTDFALHVLNSFSEIDQEAPQWFPELPMERYVETFRQTFPKPNLESMMGAAEVVCAMPLRIIEGLHKQKRHSFTSTSKLLDRCFEINYIAVLFQMYTIGYHGDIPITKEGREKKEKQLLMAAGDTHTLRPEEVHADLMESGNVWFTDEIAGSEVEWPIGKWLDDHDQSPFIDGKKQENAEAQYKLEVVSTPEKTEL